MIASDAHGVLRRKARSGRSGYEARVMTPARAVRLALARAAEKLFDLPLVVTGVQVGRVTQEMVLEQINDEWLITVLDGSDGAVGVSAIDMPFLGALVECQTLGRVLPRPSEAREPTQIDAALFAPLIDLTLSAMSEELVPHDDDIPVRGFRFGARIDCVRMLGLLLQAPEFHLFRLDVELGDGAKYGEMVLALPLQSHTAIAGASGGAQGSDTRQLDREQQAGFKEQGSLMGAEVSLDAVLWRYAMPLPAIRALAVGDVLDFPKDALSRVQLHTQTDCLPGSFQLGQRNGFRAIRVNAHEMQRERGSELAAGTRQVSDAPPATEASMPAHWHEKSAQGMDLSQDHEASAKLQPRDDSATHDLSSTSPETGDQVSDLPDLSDLPEFS